MMSRSFNLSSLFFLSLFGLMEADGRFQMLFKKEKKAPSLTLADTISTLHVLSQTDCSFGCLNEPTCVGFKYKHGVTSPSINCQLSNTTVKNNMADGDDQGWVFFSVDNVLPQHHKCFGYQWLNESSRNQNSGKGGYCADGLSGWYRFGGGAGIKIATSCLPRGRCGTVAPGWMNGTHPAVADGNVTRKVCYISREGNCCRWSNDIEVVNCGQYYVYELSPPPTCILGYCGSDN